MFGVDVVVILIVALVVVLVWRGPKTLPRWGEMLGRGVKAARKEASDLQDDMRTSDDEPTPPTPPTPA